MAGMYIGLASFIFGAVLGHVCALWRRSGIYRGERQS